MEKRGFTGFYRGLAPNLVGIIPEKAIKLAVNDYCREYFANKSSCNPDKLGLVYGVLSGAIAGTCQVIVTNPMEMVKIQLQLGSSSAISTVKELGIRGLYRYTTATLCRDVPFSFIFFPFLAICKSTFGGDDPSLAVTFTSGIIAGASAAGLVTPMDCVKTRLQARGSKYNGILDCYRQIITKEGPKALFKGCVPRMMIVSPLFAITVLVYEAQQRFLSRFQ